MVGNGSNPTSRGQLKALCTATGGRYDAVDEDDENYIAETFEFFEKTVLCPPVHVQARVQAVKTYTDLVRARKVLDCGVNTVFVKKDSACVEELVAADQQRESLCHKIHGVPCEHGEDRVACLQACQLKLNSGKPFAKPTAESKTDALGDLLDCSLFVAKNFAILRGRA